MMLTDKEIALLNRRVVYVMGWIDEEHNIPAHYVCRNGEGKFEVIVRARSHVGDLSLGVYDDLEEARQKLEDHAMMDYNRMNITVIELMDLLAKEKPRDQDAGA